MCGRYTLTTDDYQTVADALEAAVRPEMEAAYARRFNVAPSDACWLVTVDETPGSAPKRWIGAGTWGFPTSPRRDDPGMINARSETVHERPAFRDAFWTGRCGVAADGFYEWTGPKSDRQPLWFHRADRHPFVFAAIYRDVQDPATGELERRFAILTTAANGLVAPHHDRMPVILPPQRIDHWLRAPRTRSAASIAEMQTLFAPAPPDWLEMTKVGRRVGDPRNDDPGCIEPESPKDPGQQTLF